LTFLLYWAEADSAIVCWCTDSQAGTLHWSLPSGQLSVVLFFDCEWLA